MNSIVRRASGIPLPMSPELASVPTRSHTHHSGPLVVESHVELGAEPTILLAWTADALYWRRGYRVLGFRSVKGFSPEQYPKDLNGHGDLILESRKNEEYLERPPEGTYFYTFVLYKKVFLRLLERMEVIRFSEAISTAKVAVGRVKDQMELGDLGHKHELGQLNHDSDVAEAEMRRMRTREQLHLLRNPPPPEPPPKPVSVVSEELERIDALVEAFILKRQKIAELKNNPDFLSLPAKERKAVMEQIKARLDGAEVSAWREMRESK